MHDGKIFLLGLLDDFSVIGSFDTSDFSFALHKSRGYPKDDDAQFPASSIERPLKFAGTIGQGETYYTVQYESVEQ